MQNQELSSLDPNTYEIIFVCSICNYISTEPRCRNDHSTAGSNSDFEKNRDSTLSNGNRNRAPQNEKSNNSKVCAIIPWSFKSKMQTRYLCPVCGFVSSNVECKQDHNIQTLKDVCNICGADLKSTKAMLQHRLCCKPRDNSIKDGILIKNTPQQQTQHKLCKLAKPVSLCLPENLASLVQKGNIGTGQYQVMTAVVDTSTNQRMDSSPECDSEIQQDILDWDESEDLAVLDMDDSCYELLETDEYVNESQREESKENLCVTQNHEHISNNRGYVSPENRELYSCTFCELKVMDIDTCITHYLSHGTSTFVCQFCLRRYRKPHWFKFHMKKHEHELPLLCSFCDKSFLSTKLREDHLEAVHQINVKGLVKTQMNSVMCMECGIWLESDNFKTHKKLHDFKKAHSRGQNQRESLKTVINYQHQFKAGTRKPVHIFECNICFENLKSIEEVQQHMMSHDASIINKCKRCGLQFPSTSQLQLHICPTPDPTPNRCTDCGKVFVHAAGLPYHRKVVHKINTIPCSKCEMKFKTLSNYILHRSKYHPEV